VLRLFSKFQVIYGHKWLSIIDTDELLALAVEEWAERLHGLTGEEIKHGISMLEGEWPPTPHGFRELCTGSDMHKSAAYSPFTVMIEQKCDKELAADNMAKIKKLIGD